MRHFVKLWNNYTRPKFRCVIREFKILQKIKVNNILIKEKNMKTKLQMIIKILIKKKVVLLNEERNGVYRMIFSGCDVIEANKIKDMKYDNT